MSYATISDSTDRIAARRVTTARAAWSAVAIGLAGALLYYSLRGIDWREVWRLMAAAKPGYLACACALSAGALFLRALRWRVLLRAEGEVGRSAAFWATAAGYFGNNFLPARGGELVRTFMISSRSTLSRTYVLTTALAERAADAIVLVTIGAVVLLTLPARPGWLAPVSRPLAAAGLFGVAVIALLPRLERFGRALLERVAMPATLRARLMTMLEHVLRGVRAFHDARRLLQFLGLTLVIWSMDATATVIAGRSLGLEITLPVALLLLAGLGLGSALPSTPGYAGIYQFVAVSVLTPFGFTRTAAIAFILLAQALSYLVMGVWGALGFWQYHRMAPRAAA
jgi:glycosyltransferase 2 family protein